MQYIDKKLTMPLKLEKWVKKTKPRQWKLSQDYREGYEMLREQLRLEQHGLCCYCCQALQTQATIEHLKCRQNHPNLTYTYDNLLLSCEKKGQCEKAKANQELPLTPLMTECDSEIKINLVGELIGKTDRANQAIQILNLNKEKLCRSRQSKINEMSFTFDPLKSDYPIEILDRATLEQRLESFGETPAYYEYHYLLKKLA